MDNDLISREALKEATKSFTDCDGFNPVWQIIDNVPTVEPKKVLVANVTFDKDQLEQLVRDRVIEPIKNGELVLQTDERPHGEWIVDKLTRDVICSNCRQSRRDTRTTHIFFCNHCGADMRGGEDNR